MSAPDLYAILGLSRSASQDEISKTYRKLARKYHPDLHKNDPKMDRKFKEITAAYNVLSDAEKRKLYDEFGPESLQAGFDAKKAQAYRQYAQQFGGGFGGGGPRGPRQRRGGATAAQEEQFDFGNLGDIFGDLFSQFGGGGAAAASARAAQRSPQVSEHPVDVPFRDAVLGGKIDIALGVGSTTKNLKVSIPAGTNDGDKIRLSGEKTGLGVDVILVARVQPHAFLKREDHNLRMDLPLKLSELVNGAKVIVPTLSGEVALNIPPGSASGAVMRLKGKGVPRREGGAGDLLVRLQLAAPDLMGEELKSLAVQLDRYYTRDPRRAWA